MNFAEHHPLRGVLLAVIGVFFFSCMDSITKVLAGHYPVPLVVGMRYLVHFTLMLVLLGPFFGKQLIRTRRTGLVIVRGACLAAASLFLTLALQRMPIAESTAILFLAPVLVMLFAGRLLGEKVTRIGWIAAGAGFIGVLLIARPGGSLDSLGVAFAIACAGVTVGYQTLSRVLASTEQTVAMLFYTGIVGSVVFGAAIPLYWPAELPPLVHLAMFLGTGAMGAFGHFLFTAAHRYAPASTIAPILYAQLLWAGLLGWIVFDHIPDAAGLVGIAIIAGSGLLVALKSRAAQRVLEEPPEA
jgi:drug/metabolite transporter (DMT)-like permease